MKKNEAEPEYIDPDDFALAMFHEVRHTIIKALDYRVSRIEASDERFKPEKIEEYRKFRKYIKGMLYEKGSWEKLFKKD